MAYDPFGYGYAVLFVGLAILFIKIVLMFKKKMKQTEQDRLNPPPETPWQKGWREGLEEAAKETDG